jgi:hypothetical protein
LIKNLKEIIPEEEEEKKKQQGGSFVNFKSFGDD